MPNWVYTVNNRRTAMEITLRGLRTEAGLTQIKASNMVGIPLRTYKRYETDDKLVGTIKYDYIINKLTEATMIDEDHGILTIDKITKLCSSVFEHHDVQYCYLFGSYAKGIAKENSDIDLLIATSYTGLKYYGLLEELKQKLKKNLDLLNLEQINNNPQLLNEILMDGIKIYG